jgi:hypothetical protein
MVVSARHRISMQRSAKMSQAPIVRRLQPLEKPKGLYVDAPEGPWSRLVATIAGPDLPMIVAFCLTGLLIALSVIQRFPDFGAVIEQFNQF